MIIKTFKENDNKSPFYKIFQQICNKNSIYNIKICSSKM